VKYTSAARKADIGSKLTKANKMSFLRMARLYEKRSQKKALKLR
jgi:hypothetical protein